MGRLEEVLDDYVAAAQGRGEVRRLPVLSDDDAVSVVERVHTEMDRAEAARATLAREGGRTIACAPGCNFCCANVIMVYEPEALRVASWLSTQDEAREQFIANYPAWKAQVGDAPERLQALHADEEYEKAQALYDDLQRRQIMCAFNREGSCTIYPVRPNVCRHAHALDTALRCRPESTEAPQAQAFPPLDAFVSRTAALFRTIDERRNGLQGAAALCDTVHRLLGTK